jgi:hypothetical protein
MAVALPSSFFDRGQRLSIPLSLAQTQMEGQDSYLISAIRVLPGLSFSIGWLGINIVRTVGTPLLTKLQPFLPACYVALYPIIIGSYPVLPSSTPLMLVGADISSIEQNNPGQTLQISSPGDYGLFAVNNTIGSTYDVSVNGSAQVMFVDSP